MKIEAEQIKVEKLSGEHDLQAFNCGDSDLDSFLRKDALTYQKELVSNTYLCIYDGRMIAYFSLSADSVRLDEVDREKFKARGIGVMDFPAVKVGRLAVNKRYQRRGIGKFVMNLATGKAALLSKSIGCRLLTVDAHPQATKFYEKLGFKPIRRYKKKNPVMYLDIITITRSR